MHCLYAAFPKIKFELLLWLCNTFEGVFSKVAEEVLLPQKKKKNW